jgi:coenzyme F420-reducing hydrogenase beta subunit
MITDFKNCTGCRACEQKCGKKAISMQYDSEGFLYPRIDNSLCNDCGLCEKICPILRDDLQNSVLETFAAKNLNKKQMLKSSSGGIFPILAESILEQNGVVFGCAYNENLVAKHIVIENSSELCKLQNSKYVQSDTLNTFAQVKDFLEQNRKVLYSGTPCQIAGLKAFCAKDYENLITIDLICYGVPSPKLFAKYIEWLTRQLGEEILEYNFRSKDRKGWGYEIKVKTKSKNKYFNASCDPYNFSFSKGENFRESCYSCRYTSKKRTSDLTLGDYWGIDEVHPDFFSKDGISVVLINSQKGKKLWENVQSKVESIQSSFEKCSEFQAMLKKPAKRPIKRDFVYKCERNFFEISFLQRLKCLIPMKIKKRIKGVLKI